MNVRDILKVEKYRIVGKDEKGACNLCLMAVRVVEFSSGVYKIRKILHKNQHTKSKLLNLENWTNGEPQ